MWLRALWRRVPELPFLGICMGLLAAGQAGLALSANPGWKPVNDAAIFTRYLNHLAATGESPESLGALSGEYDYRVWTRRAHPFYLGLRKAFGKNFGRATALFQIILSVLPLPFIWRMVRPLFGRETACWATIFQVVFPFRWVACLELNHHLLGGLCFTAGLWTIVEYFRTEGNWKKRLGLSAATCALVPVMAMEGGIDWVYAVSVWVVALGQFAAKRVGWRGLAAALAGLWLAPLLSAKATAGPVVQRIAAADLHHLETGAVAFMARGWVPETGGEYAYSHERIDCLTPPPLKTGVQKRLLLSQLAYNAPTVFFRLFPTKLAKYFLVGFASGAEEMLNANGARTWAAAAKGARVAFALLFLPLAVIGGLRMAARSGNVRYWPFLTPCVLMAAAYVCTGETSPRYSIYIQPLLFALAGVAAARGHRHGPLDSWAKRALPSAGALAMGFAAVSAIGIFAVAPKVQPEACIDARNWQGEGTVFSRPLPDARKPFLVELRARRVGNGTAWGPLELPGDAAGRDLVGYAFPAAGRGAIRWTPVEWTAMDATGGTVRLPACLRIPGKGNESGLTVEWSAPFETDESLLWGYAFWTDPASDSGSANQTIGRMVPDNAPRGRKGTQ